MEENYLVNYSNYYYYAEMIKRKELNMVIYVPGLSINNIDEYVDGILNILRDGIDTEQVQESRIIFSWGGDIECGLNFVDSWFNLFMWKMLLRCGNEIRPKHLFWVEELKVFNIKEFVDNFVLTKENKINIGNYMLNIIMSDSLWNYSYIEDFSFYLANTINNEDDIMLMKASDEYRSLLHSDFSNIPLADVNNVGMEYVGRAIDIIKNSIDYLGYEHGLTNSFRASEAISPRQFKEVQIGIGTKSNGSGMAFPYVINNSFRNGGINNPTSYMVEASAGRAAQIMSKQNVGTYGDFARLLGLNNTDTILNRDPNYECNSKQFVKYEIKTKDHLSMIKDRRYRRHVNGVDYVMTGKETDMIGSTVYLKSPITCVSHANGTGICRACYGDLYYTNTDINIGKFAAENLSAQETQKSLSAKHIMETIIKELKWNPEFESFFNIDVNAIFLNDYLEFEIPLKKYTMVINPDDVELTTDEEDSIIYNEDGSEAEIDDVVSISNEFITKFAIVTPEGLRITFTTEDKDELYITTELNSIIRKKATNENNEINISLNNLLDIELFYVKVNNNELSKLLNDVVNAINKKACIEGKTKDEALQQLVDSSVEVGLHIDSVHLEVLLSNQVVDPEDIIKKPDWSDPNSKHRVVTLNEALTNNKSIIISLLYRNVHKTLYHPLSYTKNAPSFFDLFFMVQPQVYINDDLIVDSDDVNVVELETSIPLCKIVDNTKERQY